MQGVPMQSPAIYVQPQFMAPPAMGVYPSMTQADYRMMQPPYVDAGIGYPLSGAYGGRLSPMPAPAAHGYGPTGPHVQFGFA